MTRFPFRRPLAALLSVCLVCSETAPVFAGGNPVSVGQAGGAAVPTPIIPIQQQQSQTVGKVEGIPSALTGGQPIGFQPQAFPARTEASREGPAVEVIQAFGAEGLRETPVERIAAALKGAPLLDDSGRALVSGAPSDGDPASGIRARPAADPSARIPDIAASHSVQAAAERLDRLYSGALRTGAVSPVVLRDSADAGLRAGAPKAVGGKKAPEITPHGTPSYDYPRMFDLLRRLLTRNQVRAFLRESFKEELTVSEELQKKYGWPDRIRDVSASQFMLLLQYNSEHWPLLDQYLAEVGDLSDDDKRLPELATKWRKAFRELFRTDPLKETFKVLNDPMKAMQLKLPGGKHGYGEVRVHANNPSIVDGKELPPEDLKQVVLDFIAGAKTQLMLNVFDFDLMDVAEALIAKAKKGVKVTVGIDKGVIDARPEVKAVFDALSRKKNVVVYAVESVGLNHQKLIVRDWEDPKRARTLLSSGNLTQSCIGPEGDAVGLDPRPEFSKPNANHMIEVEGPMVALAVANNLTLTLDPQYRLKGRGFPLNGAFKVFGSGKWEDGEPWWTLFTFTPNGALGNVSRDILYPVLVETRGPVRQIDFATSAPEFADGLVERARLEKKEGHKFDYKRVGDTPFSMRPWSVSLYFSGLELKEDGDTKEYVPLKDNPLRDVLGKEAYEALLKDIRIGPPDYKEHQVAGADGKSVKVNAKIHDKVVISGKLVVAGTSFNFSENANSNNEQFFLFKDPRVLKAMNGVFDGLFRQTTVSVAEEAARRNELYKNKQGVDESAEDSESRHAEEQIRRARQKTPPKAGPSSASPLASGVTEGPGPLAAASAEPGMNAEFRRKLFHQGTLLYLAGYWALGPVKALKAAALTMAAVTAVETARLFSSGFRSRIQSLFGPIIREKEAGRFTGTFYTSLGVLTTLLLFGMHPPIVTASLLYLAWGDAASALVGRGWGRNKYAVFGQTRSVEGTLAGLAVALGVGFLVGLTPGLMLGGALAFSLVDTLPIPPDDNLWIPVVTSAALFLLGA